MANHISPRHLEGLPIASRNNGNSVSVPPERTKNTLSTATWQRLIDTAPNHLERQNQTNLIPDLPDPRMSRKQSNECMPRGIRVHISFSGRFGI
ncbi:hypothetical protein TorRG33x02_040450 [Trema orientale]|uniref:Uncharacterized protein n=1 Tax=Trema orientale TaxID=63057 RepID=A0A2P5FR37_TREOI|nr:hypothetical protein TorRG33x02_040450 [Trema orientale]